VAREIAAVVQAHAAQGRTYDLVLLGNDAADTGDFQVGIRLAYALGRPVVTGASTVELEKEVATARVSGPDGVETYAVPLPAVVTVLEGGVEPRYPTISGRMKAKKVKIEMVAPQRDRPAPAVCVCCRPPSRARSRCSARGRTPRRPWSTCWRSWGGAMILVFVGRILSARHGRRDRGVAGGRHVRAHRRRADGRAGARGDHRSPSGRAGRPARRLRGHRDPSRHR
jgi:hypothetical protein